MQLILFILSLSVSAFASELLIHPEGDDGGYRLKGVCVMAGETDECPIDTAAPMSVVALNESNRAYPSLGERTIGSIGLEMHCSLIKIPDFEIFGAKNPDAIFHRCENLPSVRALIGLDFFMNHSFILDFARGSLAMDGGYSGITSLLAAPASTGKIIVTGSVGKQEVRVAIDTGAPVTLMDQKFVEQYPEVFVESTKPPSEMMKRRGLRRYEMRKPFVIGGVSLSATFVHTADILGFSQGQYVGLVGANHMKNANWFFDLKQGRWAVYR